MPGTQGAKKKQKNESFVGFFVAVWGLTREIGVVEHCTHFARDLTKILSPDLQKKQLGAKETISAKSVCTQIQAYTHQGENSWRSTCLHIPQREGVAAYEAADFSCAKSDLE